jgi:NADH-quinone oxidoreductase subunit M
LGLPGLNSFAGEFLILLGVFRVNMALGVLGAAVIVPAAWYVLRFLQGVMQGPRQQEGLVAASLRKGTLTDISLAEFWTVAPLLILIVYIGIQPAPFVWVIEKAVPHVMQPLSSAFIH